MAEIGIEQARKSLGDIANRADLAGTITYLTRNGRRVAAVVPLERIVQTVQNDPTVRVQTYDRASGEIVEVELMAQSQSPAALGADLSATDLGCEPGTEYRVVVLSEPEEGDNVERLYDEVVTAR